MQKVVLEEDFIPNFKFLTNGGEVCNSKSKIIQVGELAYVSDNQSVNVFDTNVMEVVRSYYNRKHKVTFFTLEDKKLLIGYKNGLIELIDEEDNEIIKFRAHKKQINFLKLVDGCVLSACADGSIILYDLVLESVKMRYKGNSFCIDACACDGTIIVAGCSDSTLKIWDLESEDLRDTIVFDRRIRNVFVYEKNIIVFFMDCDTLIIDLETKETQKWLQFKKIKSVKQKTNFLSVLTNKKLTRFEVKTHNKFKLVELDNEKMESLYVDFDYNGDTKILINTNNQLDVKTVENSFGLSLHKSVIINILIDNNENICSFSSDKLIVWQLDDDKLKFVSTINISEGESFTCFNNLYVVGTKTNLIFYNINTRDLVLSKEKNVTAVDADKNTLVVASANEIEFYNEKLEVYDRLDLEESATYLKLESSINLLFVAKLNSKVYVYELPTLDRKLVLYGHSLPVKHISVSPNQKNVITTGADKVIKIWGLQFGECLKTIVNDTQNTEFINGELFMVGSNTLKYYKRFELIKEYKYKASYVKLIGEYLFSAFENAICVFKMDKYELNLEESSEESDEELQRDTEILNTRNYDEFLTLVEELEDKSNEPLYQNTIEKFYNFLDKISLSEIDSYLILLSPINIDALLGAMPHYIDRNILLVSRVIMTMVNQHKDIVTTNANFKNIVIACRTKLEDARELFGMNMMALKLMDEGEIREENDKN